MTLPQPFQASETKRESFAGLALSDELVDCVRRALSEDIGSGDVTTEAIVSSAASGAARIVAKQSGVFSGSDVARAVFLLLSPDVRVKIHVSDGDRISGGQTLLELSGPARAVLTGERTALNFLGRMSGIATLTRQFVDAIAGTGATILDTRKTAPGLRLVDKLAVQHGGGVNHRFGLYDMVLIKNNHIDHMRSLSDAVRAVRAGNHELRIEIEARTPAEVQEGLDLKVERILLDNMSLEDLRAAVALCDGRIKLEASGNVSLENVRAIAETGVDFISVGALTHSARSLDISMRWAG